MFTHGLDIHPRSTPLGFTYGPKCFGPTPELRTLDAIRTSLRNPNCDGPDLVYAIAMDVGRPEHREDLLKRQLLFGVVTYAAGQIGHEPIRSQGHIHALSPSCGYSTAEVYEIWSGRAIILMQESAKDQPGRCFAVSAQPGEVVVVPPNWAHATISADPTQPLTFGAWCVRDYGFDYTDVRAHGGLAYFPELKDGHICWHANPRYEHSILREKSPEHYHQFGLENNISIYEQYCQNNQLFDFVPQPNLHNWDGFTP